MRTWPHVQTHRCAPLKKYSPRGNTTKHAKPPFVPHRPTRHGTPRSTSSTRTCARPCGERFSMQSLNYGTSYNAIMVLRTTHAKSSIKAVQSGCSGQSKTTQIARCRRRQLKNKESKMFHSQLCSANCGAGC